MKLVTSLFFILAIAFTGYSQQSNDNRYLEDQIYLAVSYNLLLNKPKEVTQNGFSGGMSIGFLKDLPINKQRNKAFAIGLGYSYNAYIQNIKITKNNTEINFDIPTTAYNSNRFVTHALELPIEFRWRTSTEDIYKFWRVYAGGKVSYIFSNKSKFSDASGIIKLNNIDDFEKLQYGLTLSIGYSTWNFYTYYGLNNLFKESTTLNSNPIDLTDLKLGLIFYIL